MFSNASNKQLTMSILSYNQQVTKANRDSLIDQVTEMVQQLYDAHLK